MSALTELDTSYIKSINALHSKDHLLSNKPSLQTFLEEAIKAKTGKDMNLTAMVQSLMKTSGIDILSTPIEDTRIVTASDNEIDLDLLLKEDLACVICQGMDVGARNRLLECSDCHALYHQECHQPPVSQHDADNAWICVNCKVLKKTKSPLHSSSTSSSHSSKPKSTSNSPRHSTERSERSDRSDRGDRGDRSDRSLSSGYKSSSSSSSKSGSKGSSSSSSGGGSKSSSSSSKSSSKHTPVTTSSSIVSADKRLQNMKKKAAKLHEKKKLPR